ncbi:hypothetical protein FP2506_08661 [Fulvimarina pelagi HTCC2506]|uniref:Uncharacterized protein n=1 Tax=Fulvimarina pelagi HTCC2506 TaxID=314231 RepID=Q0G614_9HYPH|nr:hypothetical protein [Fulvimarina pelagi]EAU42900.1 hypothetical protein FP2506_08661 [Fulvimarina pelagi HTCC2506]
MLKTLRIATFMAGVSAFAIPAFAQTEEPVIPGSESSVEAQEEAERDAVSASEGAATDAPAIESDAEAELPATEPAEDAADEEEREMTAEDPAGSDATTVGETDAVDDDGENSLVPGVE